VEKQRLPIDDSVFLDAGGPQARRLVERHQPYEAAIGAACDADPLRIDVARVDEELASRDLVL
jgi:hypothetical protein